VFACASADLQEANWLTGEIPEELCSEGEGQQQLQGMQTFDHVHAAKDTVFVALQRG
jgi:hypothetical protein